MFESCFRTLALMFKIVCVCVCVCVFSQEVKQAAHHVELKQSYNYGQAYYPCITITISHND